MKTEDRRAFLLKLARGVGYVTPAIISVTAPLSGLSAQGSSSEHKHAAITAQPSSPPPVGGPPPWQEPPPGRRQP